MSRRAILHFVLIAACAPLSACSPTIRKPQLFGPGSAPMQRANAEVFDPYPQPDVGPEIVGGRPLEYAAPRNEVERSQDFLRSRGARPVQEVGPAPIPIGPPLAMGAPIPVGQPITVGQPIPVAPALPVAQSPRPATPTPRY